MVDKIPWDACVIALISCTSVDEFARDCSARVKKRHKCKFVPRLLSMIVDLTALWMFTMRRVQNVCLSNKSRP